jgi:hypothetical protein
MPFTQPPRKTEDTKNAAEIYYFSNVAFFILGMQNNVFNGSLK